MKLRNFIPCWDVFLKVFLDFHKSYLSEHNWTTSFEALIHKFTDYTWSKNSEYSQEKTYRGVTRQMKLHDECFPRNYQNVSENFFFQNNFELLLNLSSLRFIFYFAHGKIPAFWEVWKGSNLVLKHFGKIIFIFFYFHCVKNVQIRSNFCSVFSCIRTEYGDLLRNFPYSVRKQENTDQK